MPIGNHRDILAEYAERIKYAEIAAVRNARVAALERNFWQPVRELLGRLPPGAEIWRRGGRLPIDLCTGNISIGERADLAEDEHQILDQLIRKLIPWRKGPFLLFGHEIDAEWRSDFKWTRIEPHLGPLSGKRVLDIGCNNGYYMLRLAGLAASRRERLQCVLGIDPSEHFFHCFELFQSFVQESRLKYELLGVEHVNFFPEFFDLVLCLGIVYHQREPLKCLREIRGALKPGGVLLLESQAIAGDEPLILADSARYAKAHNVYFVPTAESLCELTEQAGFRGVEVVSFEKVTSAEQRRTELAPYESLADFLNPQDASRTVEGYPAPHRALLIARR